MLREFEGVWCAFSGVCGVEGTDNVASGSRNCEELFSTTIILIEEGRLDLSDRGCGVIILGGGGGRTTTNDFSCFLQNRKNATTPTIAESTTAPPTDRPIINGILLLSELIIIEPGLVGVVVGESLSFWYE